MAHAKRVAHATRAYQNENVLSLQPRQCLEFDNLTLPEHQPSRVIQIVSELESQAKNQRVTAFKQRLIPGPNSGGIVKQIMND